MAENPYVPITVSGYNTSPPPDDGSQSGANQLNWSKHIDKIGDPLKAGVDDVDSATQAAFALLVMTTDPGQETVIVAVEEFF